MKEQEENNTSVKFSLRLLETMKRKEMTQKDLSVLAKISQGAVSKYLRGACLPKSLELYRIAKVLGVSMEWLMGDDEEPQREDVFWRNETIKLRAKLETAISTLEGTLKSLKIR